MRVLVVCSLNSGYIAPFIKEQVEALQLLGIQIDYHFIRQKGILGYLSERKCYIDKIKSFKPDLIHAHYGLSGLFANLQRSVKVITTYHGSDINDNKVFPFSRLAILLSSHNIFVSEKQKIKAGEILKFSIIPCGIDVKLFKPMDKVFARKELGLNTSLNYILFAGAFDNKVKNAELAKASIALQPNLILLELKDYTREEVVLLMNAVDLVLMTSFSEGSPQFIKEAMACNCPIVSVSVGDVSNMIEGLEGCLTVTYDSKDIAEKINSVLQNGKRTEGRFRIINLSLDVDSVAKRIIKVYGTIL